MYKDKIPWCESLEILWLPIVTRTLWCFWTQTPADVMESKKDRRSRMWTNMANVIYIEARGKGFFYRVSSSFFLQKGESLPSESECAVYIWIQGHKVEVPDIAEGWLIYSCRRSLAIGNDKCTLWSTFAHLLSPRASNAGETKLWVPLQRKDNGQSGSDNGTRISTTMAPTLDFFLPGPTPHCRLLPCAAVCFCTRRDHLPAGRIAIHMYVIWRSKPRDTAGFGRTMVWLELPSIWTGPQRDVLLVFVTRLPHSLYMGSRSILDEIHHSGKYKVCGRRAHNILTPFSHGHGHWLVPHLQ